jgi:hypothetical protein
VIPQILATGSDDTSVYVASQFELIQIDKITGTRRSVIGAVIDPSIGGGNEGSFSFPQGLTRDGDYLYFSNSDGRLQRAFLGVDGKSSLQTIVPQVGLVNFANFDSVAGNETDAFWVSTDGATLSQVYRKSYASDEPAKLIAAIDAGAKITATATQVYITVTNPPASRSVSRLDLGTGAIFPLQNLAPSSPTGVPTAVSAGYFYWVNGSTLYRVAHSGSVPEVVIDGMASIANITADDSVVYVVQVGAIPNVISRVDVAAKTSTPILPVSGLTNILLYQGNLYWATSVTSSGLFTLNPDGTARLLSPTAGNTDLIGVAGKIVTSGVGTNGISFYDIAAETSTVRLLAPLARIYADSQSVYYGSTNSGIVRIPADLNYRVPENLPTPNGVNRFRVNSGWIYISEFTTFFSTEQRISRMHLDGTQYEPLFIGEHRGLEILDNNVYFMCQSDCSVADWTLFSMALEGGTPDPLGDVGLDPQRIMQRNRTFYVDTSLDGFTLDVFSINLDLGDVAHLLGPFSPISGTSTIDASSRWLYRGEGFALARYKITAPNKVEPRQVVDTGDILTGRTPIGSSVHTDGKYVYYWYSGIGLKRLSEDK